MNIDTTMLKNERKRSATQLLKVFQALSDQRRLDILRYLAGNSVGRNVDFMELLELKQPAVSYHLKTLNRAGLISQSKSNNVQAYCLNRNSISAFKDLVIEYLSEYRNDSEHETPADRCVGHDAILNDHNTFIRVDSDKLKDQETGKQKIAKAGLMAIYFIGYHFNKHVYQQIFIDRAKEVILLKIHQVEKPTVHQAIEMLNEQVLDYCYANNLKYILTDHSDVYCKPDKKNDFSLVLKENDIEHIKTTFKLKHSNKYCYKLHRILLHSLYHVGLPYDKMYSRDLSGEDDIKSESKDGVVQAHTKPGKKYNTVTELERAAIRKINENKLRYLRLTSRSLRQILLSIDKNLVD